jgi:membrane carboxypeptidase/penicillin-binding protein PbpC
VQGGSSITQQLIKNVIIPVEERTQQSYARKIKEVILAMEVTRRYPKEKSLSGISTITSMAIWLMASKRPARSILARAAKS